MYVDNPFGSQREMSRGLNKYAAESLPSLIKNCLYF